MYLVVDLQWFPIWKLSSVNLHYIDKLKLRTYDWLFSVLHKYLPSLLSSSYYGELYKPSNLVGLVKMDLTLCWFRHIFPTCCRGLYDLHRVASLLIFRNHHWFYLTLYIEICIFLTSLFYGVIFLHYESFWVYKIIGDSSPL